MVVGPPDVTIEVPGGLNRPRLPDVAAQARNCTGTSSSGENAPPGAVVVAQSQRNNGTVTVTAATAAAESGETNGDSAGAIKVVATEADYNRERESDAPIVILGKGEDWANTTGVEFGFALNEDLLHSRPGDHRQQQQQQLNQHQQQLGGRAPAPLHLEDEAILSFTVAPQQQQQQLRREQLHQQHPTRRSDVPVGANELHQVGDGPQPPQHQQQQEGGDHVAPSPSPAATEPPSTAAPVYDASFLQIVCYVAAKWHEVSQELNANKRGVVYFQLRA